MSGSVTIGGRLRPVHVECWTRWVHWRLTRPLKSTFHYICLVGDLSATRSPRSLEQKICQRFNSSFKMPIGGQIKPSKMKNAEFCGYICYKLQLKLCKIYRRPNKNSVTAVLGGFTPATYWGSAPEPLFVFLQFDHCVGQVIILITSVYLISVAYLERNRPMPPLLGPKHFNHPYSFFFIKWVHVEQVVIWST